VVKLLDERKIPCQTVGKYRRVRPDDLIIAKHLGHPTPRGHPIPRAATPVFRDCMLINPVSIDSPLPRSEPGRIAGLVQSNFRETAQFDEQCYQSLN
jgi:hypothetical protein